MDTKLAKQRIFLKLSYFIRDLERHLTESLPGFRLL